MNVAHAREREPVVFDAAIGQWFAFLYEDLRAGLADPRLTADRMLGFADRAPASVVEPVRRHAAWLISRDGADYGWLRPVVHAGLRGATSPASERAIALAADELLDGLLEQGTFDVAGEYAFALSPACWPTSSASTATTATASCAGHETSSSSSTTSRPPRAGPSGWRAPRPRWPATGAGCSPTGAPRSAAASSGSSPRPPRAAATRWTTWESARSCCPS